MKALIRSAILAAALCLIPAFTRAQVGPAQPAEDFQQTLSKATLSVYQGQQVCGYQSYDTIFGPMQFWGCKFERRFTCTATVIADAGNGYYVGLSAGHCINWAEEKNYFVGTTVEGEPVLHNIKIVKSENDDRYDYVLFEFHSVRPLPVIEVDTEGGVPALGTKVINVNFAFGVGKHYSRGEVTSEPLSDEVFGSKQRFTASVEGAPGASGSAIVSLETHKIIGLCEFGFNRGNLGMGAIPTGKRFIDFIDDDSAGLRPQPEPKQQATTPQSFFSQCWAIARKLFFYTTGF